MIGVGWRIEHPMQDLEALPVWSIFDPFVAFLDKDATLGFEDFGRRCRGLSVHPLRFHPKTDLEVVSW